MFPPSYFAPTFYPPSYFPPAEPSIPFPAGGPGGPEIGETYTREEEELITLIALMIETGIFDDG
jgi:hypothetical protein